MSGFLITLVGPDHQENLALGYLATAVEAAGHRAELVGFNTRDDQDRCVARVVELSPDVVGLAIPFQYGIADVLELAGALRRRGFRGHVTCGGHVPSFCATELLRDCAALDSAVRFEGERTLIELLDRLARSETLRGVRGLAWRDGDQVVLEPPRPVVEDLRELGTPRRRHPPMVVGGVPVAFLLTARGCVGDCAYCCIRAFNREAGGKPFRVAPADFAADEMATLVRDHGVEVFFVQDDLFILPSEARTLRRMSDLKRELAARDVSRPLLWIKGRPETITREVVAAADDLGAIHIFLGVESGSASRLRYLGRTHGPDDNRRALAIFREMGMKSSFNLMLFDPDCTLDDVAASIELAEENLDVPWNVCRTEIYSGTALLRRLEAEGRLIGDYTSLGYVMSDASAEVMFRIMRVGFHERAFAFDSLLNRLISLSFAMQIHERLFPGPESDDLRARVDRLQVETHRDCVDEMWRLLELSRTLDLGDVQGMQRAAASSALASNARDLPRYDACERLWRYLHDRGSVLGGRKRRVIVCPP
jgi:methylmalonyl-CoA mutase cobalamin-binding subunit